MKIYKDHIVEEVEPIKAEEEIIPAADKNVDELAKSSIINELIRGKWEEVDKLTAIIGTQEDEALKDILNLFLHDTYIHIGQLEKFLEGDSPEVKQIEIGKDTEVELQDDSTPEPTDNEEIEELPPDDLVVDADNNKTVQTEDNAADKINNLKELIASYQAMIYDDSLPIEKKEETKELLTKAEKELSDIINELYIKD